MNPRYVKIFALAGLAAALVWITVVSRHRDVARRNLVIISIDALRADRVGMRDRATSLTPNLDRFAAAGTVFDNAYAQATLTYASHASLLCGMYPASIPAPFAPRPIPRNRRLLAELLKAFGYDTAAFTGGAMISGQYGFSRGFDIYNESPTFEDNFHRASMWLANRPTNGAPFFLFIHGYDVHPPHIGRDASVLRTCPIRPPYDNDVRTAHEIESDPGFFRKIWKHTYYRKLGNDEGMLYFFPHEDLELDPQGFGAIQLSAETRRHMILHYEQALRLVDDAFGHFMRQLESAELQDNTLVVVLSDHGWDFFEHGRFSHGFYGYEGTAHVVLLMRGPGIPAGQHSRQLARLIDVTPTVAARLGICAQADWEGNDLLAGDVARFAVTSAVRTLHVRSADREIVMDWLSDSFALYDRQKDPAEANDLADLPQERAKNAELIRFATSFRDEKEANHLRVLKRREWSQSGLHRQKAYVRRLGY